MHICAYIIYLIYQTPLALGGRTPIARFSSQLHIVVDLGRVETVSDAWGTDPAAQVPEKQSLIFNVLYLYLGSYLYCI